MSAGYVVLAVNPMSRRLGCWAGLEATDVVAVNSVTAAGMGRAFGDTRASPARAQIGISDRALVVKVASPKGTPFFRP